MFKPITRSQNRLRLALDGPAGSGKTYTALRFAFGIAKREGSRVAVIDTEHNSASLYAGDSPDEIEWRWEGVNLEHFAPSTYEQAINEAGRQGYGILVIDSLSHAWIGTGGSLDQVDRASAGPGGKFGAWRDVTPQHNAMINAILRYPGHVIATLRSKMEYVLEEDEHGKKRVEKIGLKPIQREGVEYEFTIVGDLDTDHRLKISKTRCSLIDGAIVVKPGPAFLAPILDWLGEADDAVDLADDWTITRIKTAAADAKMTRNQLSKILTRFGCGTLSDLTSNQAREMADRLVAKALRDAAPTNGETPAAGGIRLHAPELPSQGEAEEILRLCKELNHPVEELRNFLGSKGVRKVAELPLQTAVTLRRRLQSLQLKTEAQQSF